MKDGEIVEHGLPLVRQPTTSLHAGPARRAQVLSPLIHTAKIVAEAENLKSGFPLQTGLCAGQLAT
jgi:hypothetical protein